MHARSYAMNYSYITFLLRNYTYTERFTESMRSKDTVTSTMWEGQESAQLQLSRRKAW